MKRGGFVEAVTKAVNGYGDPDCWEARYYCDDNFNPRKVNTYMHAREAALGPEWHEWRTCIMMMRGELPHNLVIDYRHHWGSSPGHITLIPRDLTTGEQL